MQQLDSQSYTVTCVDSDGNTFMYLQTPSLDDASCLALVSTLRGFGWPAGMSPVDVTASKNVNHDTTWQCRTADNPPAFN